MKSCNKSWYFVPVQIAISALIIAAVTFIALIFKQLGLSEISIAVIYVLSVLIIARVTRGYIYGLISSVANILCFNFFFTAPYYTFHVYNKNYITAFIVMLLASILTSTLTSKILDTSALANKNEMMTRMLYQITSSLAKASGVSDVAMVSTRCISNLLDCDATFIILNQTCFEEYSLNHVENKVMKQTILEGELNQRIDGKFVLPIANQTKKYGLIYLSTERKSLDDERIKLLDSICVQICVAMEREFLADEKKKIEAQAERERFKSNLLRAISHDLRTPLSGISGAAEILQYSLPDSENQKLAHGIYDDANWLTHMVENILSLTKIEEGKLIQNMQLEAVEEVVAESVSRSSKYTHDRKITVKIPDEVIFVPMDAKLIMQVLINLIDNAVKHSPAESIIRVEITLDKSKVWFKVMDEGTGIPTEDLPYIFDLFYRANHLHADARRGMGLGLTICKSIIDAHGGSIYAENNPGGGATLKFWLPYKRSGIYE